MVYLHNSNCILGVELFFPLAPSECAHTSRLCRITLVVLVVVGYWLSFWFAPCCSLFVDVVYCGAVVFLTASRGRRRRLPFIWVCHLTSFCCCCQRGCCCCIAAFGVIDAGLSLVFLLLSFSCCLFSLRPSFYLVFLLPTVIAQEQRTQHTHTCKCSKGIERNQAPRAKNK